MTPRHARLQISLPVHLLALPPAEPGPGPPPVLLGLHGYGADAEAMLDLLTHFAPPRFLVVSLQGPQTTIVPGTEGGERKVGFHWGVSPDPEENRAAHREVVARAIRWAQTQGGDLERVSLAGFSQPCSFNYRLALAPPHGRPFRAIVSFCGGVPGEWRKEGETGEGSDASRATSVLHVSTREDSFYPPDKVAAFPAILERRFGSVVHRLHEGAHRVPSAAYEEARVFLDAKG